MALARAVAPGPEVLTSSKAAATKEFIAEGTIRQG
jgi:hypothetical protein